MKSMICKYRPALASFFLMVAFATSTTAMSFMNLPASTDLGVGIGNFTVYYSLFMLTGGLTSPLVGQFIGKFGIKKIVLSAALWGCLCMWLFSYAQSLYTFYLIGIALGFLSTAAINLLANVMVQMYYATSEAANLIGLVMAGSGVGSVMYGAVLPIVMENMGWRACYRIVGVIWVVLLVLAVGVLGNSKPVEMTRAGTREAPGMSRAEALRSPMLYLQLTAVVILMFGTGLIQHFPTILTEHQYSPAAAGALISFYSAVLTVGKILQGVLYGKLGVVKGGAITHAILIAGLLMLGNEALAYPAFAALGVGLGIVTTLTPILTKQLFGMKEYGSVFGIVTLGYAIGSFFGTPAWGYIHDFTGSYELGFVIMSVLVIVAFVLQVVALRVKKVKEN